jgi:hypothetical protein
MDTSNVIYSLGQNKPLIRREQNYVLDRKLLSIHSEDRDITKWPHANTFEILAPEPLLNVQSLRLIQSTMPNFFYTFSNEYQNTQMQITLEGQEPFILTIGEGTYTADQLANEMTNNLNTLAQTFDGSFNVFYDEVAQKFAFGHTTTSFTLNFGVQIFYPFVCDYQKIVFPQYANWGLPYYLGFAKQDYVALNVPEGISFAYVCPCPSSASGPPITFLVEAPLSFQLTGERCIYLEVDKYNNMDELYPYNQSTREMLNNNAYNGKVNAAFAKIPLQGQIGYSFDARTYFLQNFVQYDPPIERIVRLRFRFRYHDGRYVDFQNYPFDFTIEFNCLKNEIEKSYHVRIPVTYNL